MHSQIATIQNHLHPIYEDIFPKSSMSESVILYNNIFGHQLMIFLFLLPLSWRVPMMQINYIILILSLDLDLISAFIMPQDSIFMSFYSTEYFIQHDDIAHSFFQTRSSIYHERTKTVISALRLL